MHVLVHIHMLVDIRMRLHAHSSMYTQVQVKYTYTQVCILKYMLSLLRCMLSIHILKYTSHAFHTLTQICILKHMLSVHKYTYHVLNTLTQVCMNLYCCIYTVRIHTHILTRTHMRIGIYLH